MKQSGKWLCKIILILTPLLIGTLGLVQSGEDLLDAAFSSFTMYAANYGGDASNWLVEVARWTAPLATAGGVAMLFKPVARAVYARLLSFSSSSVAVYGSHELYESLRKEGRYPVVEGEDRLLPAARYLLFGEEQENVDFYLKNKKKLENKEVYMQCASLRSQVTAGTHLHLFSPEEG